LLDDELAVIVFDVTAVRDCNAETEPAADTCCTPEVRGEVVDFDVLDALAVSDVADDGESAIEGESAIDSDVVDDSDGKTDAVGDLVMRDKRLGARPFD